jgi:hypothetical protein
MIRDMTEDARAADGRAARGPDGPPAGVVATVALVLSIAAVVVPLLVFGVGFPTPTTPVDEVTGYFAGHPWAGMLAGLFTFAASVPLGICAATLYARLQRLGVRVPGPSIAFFGGLTASILLAVAGLVTWALGRAGGGVAGPVLHLFTDAVFALGGVGFVGGIGLLVAGVAVPTLLVGLAPRWLAWVGLVIAAASEISFLSLAWDGFAVLLPVGRFGALAWVAAIGFLLPHNRHEIPSRTRVGAD